MPSRQLRERPPAAEGRPAVLVVLVVLAVPRPLAGRSKPFLEARTAHRPRRSRARQPTWWEMAKSKGRPNPFAKFEKSGADKDTKGGPKEGSKKEEAMDKAQFRSKSKGKGKK